MRQFPNFGNWLAGGAVSVVGRAHIALIGNWLATYSTLYSPRRQSQTPGFQQHTHRSHELTTLSTVRSASFDAQIRDHRALFACGGGTSPLFASTRVTRRHQGARRGRCAHYSGRLETRSSRPRRDIECDPAPLGGGAAGPERIPRDVEGSRARPRARHAFKLTHFKAHPLRWWHLRWWHVACWHLPRSTPRLRRLLPADRAKCCCPRALAVDHGLMGAWQRAIARHLACLRRALLALPSSTCHAGRSRPCHACRRAGRRRGLTGEGWRTSSSVRAGAFPVGGGPRV